MKNSTVSKRYGLLVVCLGVLAGGCGPVRFVSDYDDVTDKSLTALQTKVDDFIVNLIAKSGTPAASYEGARTFYAAIDRDLRRLEFRVNSVPDNHRTVGLVKNVRATILGIEGEEDTSSLRDLHMMDVNRAKGIKAPVLQVARRNINQAISAALTLEMAKKRGSDL